MAEASTISTSATAPAKFFTRGIEGRENLLVGYLAGREVTQTRVPLRAAACGEFATKRGLSEVRNAQTGSASLSRQVIGKIDINARHAHSIHTQTSCPRSRHCSKTDQQISFRNR